MTGQRIFIPPLGSVIKLTDRWDFNIQWERRNEKLMELAELNPLFRHHISRVTAIEAWRNMSTVDRKAAIDATQWIFENGYPENGPMFEQYGYWSGDWKHPFSFEAETRLKIDRIYLRQGSGDFDSVTFRSDCWVVDTGHPLFAKKYVKGKKVQSIRFWAKLDDVNRMIGEFLPS